MKGNASCHCSNDKYRDNHERIFGKDDSLSCPLCGSSTGSIYFTKAGYKITCLDCGCKFEVAR